MEFGAVFPTCEIGTDPVAIRDYAQAAEALGYRHIITYDHVLGAPHADRDPPLWGPYTEQDAFHEPLVLLGYLAALTERVELMSGVLILPQRQTVLVAKQAAELAILSGNRVKLAMGTGWNHVEYDALGMPYEPRGRMLDEQVELLRRLWSEPLVSFDGEFHHIDRAGLNPLPDQPLPIWYGGASGVAIRRAARSGDGFAFASTIEPMQVLCRQLTEALEASDRRAGFGMDVMMGYGGGPERWHRDIDTWEALGVDTVSVRTMSTAIDFLGDIDPGLTSPRQHIDALETFMNEVR